MGGVQVWLGRHIQPDPENPAWQELLSSHRNSSASNSDCDELSGPRVLRSRQRTTLTAIIELPPGDFFFAFLIPCWPALLHTACNLHAACIHHFSFSHPMRTSAHFMYSCTHAYSTLCNTGYFRGQPGIAWMDLVVLWVMPISSSSYKESTERVSRNGHRCRSMS